MIIKPVEQIKSVSSTKQFFCKVEQKQLLKALNCFKYLTKNRSTLAILANIELSEYNHELKIRGTDLNNDISIRLPAQIKDFSKVLVSHPDLLKIIKNLEGLLTFYIDSDQLLIESEMFSSSLPLADPDDYPEPVKDSGDFWITVLNYRLKEILSKVSYAKSKGDSRVYLDSVTINNTDSHLDFMATDGLRLSLVKYPTEPDWEKKSFIIQGETILHLERLLLTIHEDTAMWVNFWTDGKKLRMTSIAFEIDTLLVDAEPIVYHKHIPKRYEYLIPLQKDKLLPAIRKCLSLVDPKVKKLILSFGYRVMTMTAKNGDTMAKIDVPHGMNLCVPVFDIGINAQYFYDAGNAVKGSEIVLRINNAKDAIQIDAGGKNPDHINIIMPMILNEEPAVEDKPIEYESDEVNVDNVPVVEELEESPFDEEVEYIDNPEDYVDNFDDFEDER